MEFELLQTYLISYVFLLYFLNLLRDYEGRNDLFFFKSPVVNMLITREDF